MEGWEVRAAVVGSNEALRAARERVPSPSVPGKCLSRTELADAVNAWLWEHTNRRFCSPDSRGRQLYAHLAQLLEREDLLFGPTRVKRSESPCLGVCAGGPVVAVCSSWTTT